MLQIHVIASRFNRTRNLPLGLSPQLFACHRFAIDSMRSTSNWINASFFVWFVYSEAMDFDYGFTFDAAGMLTDSDIEGEYNFSYIFDTGLTTFSDEDADDTPAPNDISVGNPEDDTEDDDTTSVFDYAGTFQYFFAAEMTIVFSGVNITGSSRVESRVEYTIAGTYSSTFGNTDDDESSPLSSTTDDEDESTLSGSTSGAYSETTLAKKVNRPTKASMRLSRLAAPFQMFRSTLY
jgi:hypothetical protein